MENILFFTDTQKGHMTPTFQFVRNLKEHGFNISYCGIPDAMKEVAQIGFESNSIFENYYPLGSTKGTTKVAKSAVRLILDGELDSLINRVNPKIIFVTDQNPLESLAIYYKYNLKIIVFWTHYPQGKYTHPENSPFGTSFRNLAQHLAFKNKDPQELSVFLDFVERLGYKINNLRDLLAPIKYFAHFISCSKELLIEDIPHREGEVYVGPCIFDHSVFSAPNTSFFEELKLDETSSKKIVYCSLGSWADGINSSKALQIFEAIINAFKSERLANHTLVVAAGELFNTLNVLGLPKNIFIYKWVPQVELLQYISVAIIHGGLGSLKECVTHNIPMIITPLGLDQFDNAKRVAHHGLGKELNVDLASLNQIVKIILDLINNDEVKNNLKNMNSIFEKNEAENRGVNYLGKVNPDFDYNSI